MSLCYTDVYKYLASQTNIMILHKRQSAALHLALTLPLIFKVALMVVFVLCLSSRAAIAEDFTIELRREHVNADGTVVGTILVNGRSLGHFFENDRLKIPAGEYQGVMRYISGKGFVQGPFGALGNRGDFLIEIANVRGSKKRPDILFHAGTKASHSEGCILLGAAAKGKDGIKYVYDPKGPLYQLRKLFYGTDTPNSTPNKTIRIRVADNASPAEQQALGKESNSWKGYWEFDQNGEWPAFKVEASLGVTVDKDGKQSFRTFSLSIVHGFKVESGIFDGRSWKFQCRAADGKNTFTLTGNTTLTAKTVSNDPLGNPRTGTLTLTLVPKG